MPNLDENSRFEEAKKKFLEEARIHFSADELKALSNLCAEMEADTIDKSSIHRLYEEELYPLLKTLSYHFSSIMQNIRAKKDMHAAMVATSRVVKEETEKSKELAQQCYQTVCDFLKAKVNVTDSDRVVLFDVKISLEVLAKDIVASIIGVLKRKKDALTKADYYKELLAIDTVCRRKEMPVEIKFSYVFSDLDETLKSPQLLFELKEDFLQFFSHRLKSNLDAEEKVCREIARRSETIMIRLICAVLLKYNLLPQGDTYPEILPNVSISMPRQQAYFIADLLEKILGQLTGRNGRKLEVPEERFDYIRRNLKSKAIYYDGSIDKSATRIYSVKDHPNTFIVIEEWF